MAHVNATLAGDLRAWSAGASHDPSSIELAQSRGLIAPDPKERRGLALTRKGVEFLAKWH